MVIHLWSGPRSMSTALMYSMAQRSDFRVLDEPLYGHFLAHTGVDRPCREATLSAWPSTLAEAFRFMAPTADEESGNRVLFCKHMANHLAGLEWTPFAHHRHVILFRDPAAVMASYSAHIDRPTMLDLCFADQIELMLALESAGTPPVVISSDRLQSDPEHQLQLLFRALGLEWDAAVLQWEAGARSEDGPWAPWWYEGVHASTGWEARPPRVHGVPPHLADLHAECQKLHAQLLQYAI